MKIICAATCENFLGEGPLWDFRTGRLYWVDIAAATIHWLEHGRDRPSASSLPARASAMAMRKDGSLLLATDRGVGVYEPGSGSFTVGILPEPERSGNRTNDGHADGKGRFWIGTMDDSESHRSGAVYRLDPDWSCSRVLDGLGVPNTLVLTRDCRTLYLAESKDHELYRFAVDDSGALTGRTLFAHTRGERGTPDGSALDEEGYLWNAQWGGWRVVRYAPDGRPDRVVELPVEQPTSCAFGGPDLQTLFVTSARKGISDGALSRQPLAGSVLAFRPGVRGIPIPCFGG